MTRVIGEQRLGVEIGGLEHGLVGFGVASTRGESPPTRDLLVGPDRGEIGSITEDDVKVAGHDDVRADVDAETAGEEPQAVLNPGLAMLEVVV